MKKNEVVEVLPTRIETMRNHVTVLEHYLHSFNQLREKVSHVDSLDSEDLFDLDYMIFTRICGIEEEIDDLESLMSLLDDFIGVLYEGDK